MTPVAMDKDSFLKKITFYDEATFHVSPEYAGNICLSIVPRTAALCVLPARWCSTMLQLDCACIS
jgi:hypothetical protein